MIDEPSFSLLRIAKRPTPKYKSSYMQLQCSAVTRVARDCTSSMEFPFEKTHDTIHPSTPSPWPIPISALPITCFNRTHDTPMGDPLAVISPRLTIHNYQIIVCYVDLTQPTPSSISIFIPIPILLFNLTQGTHPVNPNA